MCCNTLTSFNIVLLISTKYSSITPYNDFVSMRTPYNTHKLELIQLVSSQLHMLTFHNTALFFDLSFTLYSSFVPSAIFYPPNHCVLAHIIARFSVGRSSVADSFQRTTWKFSVRRAMRIGIFLLFFFVGERGTVQPTLSHLPV
jgi:hypothetical protein